MRLQPLKRWMASVVVVSALVGSTAHAIPTLQLYVEGATYDTDSESWITNSNQLRLWVIGNVGQTGPILGVKLTAAVMTGESGSIALAPAMTGLLTDTSLPLLPAAKLGVGADGTQPLMSDGSPLPTHGIYGAGTSFKQWDLGDFALTDSPVGDFITGYPNSFPSTGQINAYDVSITGYSMVHFDAFNHVEGFNHAIKAPFSHDAGTAVPEPGTLILLGGGLLSSTALWRKRRRSRS